jgi:hypothetical protein
LHAKNWASELGPLSEPGGHCLRRSGEGVRRISDCGMRIADWNGKEEWKNAVGVVE